MKDIFGKNLKKMRERNGWTQAKAAAEIGVGRPAYGAWEEGRSFPSQIDLVRVAKTYRITDLVGFIENEHFDPKNQGAIFSLSNKLAEDLLRRYKSADERIRMAIDLLIGMADS